MPSTEDNKRTHANGTSGNGTHDTALDSHKSTNSRNESSRSQRRGDLGPETTRHEWAEVQQRDTISMILANPQLLTRLSLAHSKSKARCKAELIQKIAIPCGIPPKNPLFIDDEDEQEEN